MFKSTGILKSILLNSLLIAILVCTYLLPTHIFAQHENDDYIRLYEEADKLYHLKNPTEASDRKAIFNFLNVAKSANSDFQFMKIESFIKAGNIYLGYENFDSSKILYHQALAENKISRNKLAYNYECYLYLGSAMYLGSVLDSAQYYYELALDIAEKYKGDGKLPEKGRLYNSLGSMYYEAANFKEAKYYFETALDFATPRKNEAQDFFTTIRNNIANCLLKMKRYDEAIALLKSLNAKGNQQTIIRQNLANAYFEQGSYDSALLIYEAEKKAGQKLTTISLNNIGRIYAGRMSWQKAQAAFAIALERNSRKLPLSKNKDVALTYLYLSDLSDKLGLFEEAINHANEALIELYFNFKPTNLFDLPNYVDESISPITSYQVFLFRANLIYQEYRSKKDQNLLIAAHQTYIKAVETSNLIARMLDNDDAKLIFLENSKNLFTQAIKVAYEATKISPIYIEDYIYILEHYKGNILQQNFEKLQLKLTAQIPLELMDKERNIKDLYAIYLTRLSQVSNKQDFVFIQKKLNNLQIELSRLQREYRSFNGSKWISRSLIEKSIPVKEIQNEIGNDKALINYFTAPDETYILCITKQKAEVKKIINGSNYKDAYRTYVNENFNFSEGRRYNGYRAAHALYGYLINPIEQQIRNKSQLIIIPDGNLFQLPFDGLIKHANTKSFLVLSHAISYHYSISLLINHTKSIKSSFDQKRILAFAPFANDYPAISFSKEFAVLPFSKTEINQQGANQILNEKATKVKFIKNYSGYNVLHLATHASLGTDSSDNWIQFAPTISNEVADKLFVHEIYNLNLNEHELIILSACESGNGQLAGGEGVLSLSRAFLYAGAKGIITTLYKSDDFVTAYIINRFYFHMREGKSPQKALRLSKVDFLQDDEVNIRLKKPGYWSNFIYTGEMSNDKEVGMFKWIVFILLLPIIIFVLIWRFNKTTLKP